MNHRSKSKQENKGGKTKQTLQINREKSTNNNQLKKSIQHAHISSLKTNQKDGVILKQLSEEKFVPPNTNLIPTDLPNPKNKKLSDKEEFDEIMTTNQITGLVQDQLRKIVFDQKILPVKKLKHIAMVNKRMLPNKQFCLENIVKDPFDFCHLQNQLISFKKCEKIVSLFGLKVDSKKRAKAFLTWLFITHNTLYLEKNKNEACYHQICTDKQLIEFSRQQGPIYDQINDQIYRFRSPNKKYCIPKEIYDIETDIQLLLNQFKQNELAYKQELDDGDLNQIAKKFYLNDADNKKLTDHQLQAIRLIISSGDLICLTGYPGTGKSMIIRAIANYYIDLGYTLLFTALSGTAVANIAEAMKIIDGDRHYIGTICKLFMHELHNKSTKSKPMIIFVDEASMVDYILFLKILVYAIKYSCQLILIGDQNQLPPLGIGQLFADIINSGDFPVARLTKIMRQRNDLSKTIMDIAQSEFTIEKSFNDCCIFIDTPDELIIPQLEKLLQNKEMTKDNTTVISAQNQNKFGIHKLNALLQEKYRQGYPEAIQYISDYGYTIHDGDTVQRLINDYDDPNKIQYNGDLYTVRKKGTEIFTDRNWDKQSFESSPKQIKEEFMLGYATTVHKSQGSQYPYVILIIPHAHSFMWKKCGRKLLYTAISRAKLKCYIIGSRKVLIEAYNSNQTIVTGLNSPDLKLPIRGTGTPR